VQIVLVILLSVVWNMGISLWHYRTVLYFDCDLFAGIISIISS